MITLLYFVTNKVILLTYKNKHCKITALIPVNMFAVLLLLLKPQFFSFYTLD